MIKLRSRRPLAKPADPGRAASEVRGSEIGTAIGRELKALFDNVAAEPIPDKFRQLLDELERKSGKA
jgi:hypothetical protein